MPSSKFHPLRALRPLLAGLILSLPLAQVYGQPARTHFADGTAIWWPYEDAKVGLAFMHPAAWRVRALDERTVTLTPRKPAGAERVVTLTVMDKGLEGAAGDLYEKDAQGWLVPGRLGPSRAAKKSGANGERLEATISCGWTDRARQRDDGKCLVALVSNGKRSVELVSGGAEVPPEVARLVKTLRVLD